MSTTTGKGRILVVDDDSEMRGLLTEFLESEGFHVDQAADGGEALRVARAAAFDRIVLDKNLPDDTGLETLPRLRRLHPDAVVVLITAFGDPRTQERAVARGASAVLFKPFELDDLLRALLSEGDGATAGR